MIELIKISEETHAEKYRGPGESFEESIYRIAGSLQDDSSHYHSLVDILGNQRFLPAGRIQSAMGSPREVTAFNCFVSGTVDDSSESIFDRVRESFQTMRMGGGIGYDFSNLRPDGDLIKTLDSKSGGPLAFMPVFDSTCAAVKSAGHRRGAQMGVLRVDHPDIEAYVEAKTNSTKLTNFNLSIGVTDEFMQAVEADGIFTLRFNGRDYRTVRARNLWDKIMRATWDWAEPGVLFIDRINRKNNLWYCERISATNPCGEQPLPPYGACLLGSFNLTKYLLQDSNGYYFNYDQFKVDITNVVPAMDNIIDRTIYPLKQQEQEAKTKRRMGLGVTGVANALEVMGYNYGSSNFLHVFESILSCLRDTCYRVGVDLARRKGSFPLFDERLLHSEFAQTLPDDIREDIKHYGLRNSHYLSIAPTGTISLCANNISSSIEPVFSYEFTRTINTNNGIVNENVQDWAYRVHGVRGKTADRVSPQEHVAVLNLASAYVDSACSKTCNIGNDVTWEDFKDVYTSAFRGGASGCTTFRAAGKRYGILNAKPQSDEEQGAACFIDPDTGKRTCE